MDASAENYDTFIPVKSYWLSRDLVHDERLDWSTCVNGTGPTDNCAPEGGIRGPCTKFLLRTSPDSNGNALHASTCYPLDPAAYVSHYLS